MTTGAVVVGSSVAGVHTALALRAAGYAGQVTLVGAEATWPYDRPPLSKSFLAAEGPLPELLTAEQARSKDLQIVLGHGAVQLDLAGRRVELEGHPALSFDHLVIATGARARWPAWQLPPGAHVLRTATDAGDLRADLAKGSRLVVIGAGFIGAEVAATARGRGMDVTMVDPQPGPLYGALGRDVSARLAHLHEANGVRTVFGTGVEQVEGVRGDLRVRLTDGRILACDTVVVGIGAEPDVDWLRGSGLVLDDGVVCDEYCRAQGAQDVYAVGDVARWFHRGLGRHVRVEHWTNAVTQATAVAASITDPAAAVPYVPSQYIWSDQYDWRIGVVGATTAAPTLVTGDDRQLAYLYGPADRPLAGAVVINWPRALIRCRRAMDDGTAFAEVVNQLAGQAAAGRRGGPQPEERQEATR
jgi:NADPH-dependent 2,4-dienoyl-CoA reductase/sulfur reductase-like enzyme